MQEIDALIKKQHSYFTSQATKPVSYRKQLLKNLKQEILTNENAICNALHQDFKKSVFEAYLTEISIVLSELKLAINNLNSWTKPKRVKPSLLNFPSSDYIYSEPYGSVLIIAPWNYPFQLAVSPLIGAIAAGNTVILKPSELTPNTSQLLKNIINKVFKEEHVTVIQGGRDVATCLLQKKWDYIFFTGSVSVGKIVAKAAAKHLTPVTLELGGKTPCIIDHTVNLKLAAKRIVWGKYLNGGQTCIAPDHVIVHNSIKSTFYKAIEAELQNAYSQNPKTSDDYPRIINEKNFNRLKSMLDKQTIIIGGETNKEQLYIAPTVIDEPALNSKLMEDEIFGPILPVLSYTSVEDIKNIIMTYAKPLSLYVFSKNKQFVNHILQTFSFGGGVVNDVVVHFANHKLPFGGVGNSGIGAYHGKLSFDTFSHKKSIVKRGTWLDIPFRYAPYKGKLRLIKKVFKHLS